MLQEELTENRLPSHLVSKGVYIGVLIMLYGASATAWTASMMQRSASTIAVNPLIGRGTVAPKLNKRPSAHPPLNRPTLRQLASGQVWAWGANNRGQLGIGTTIYSNIPLPTHGISDAIAIAAGSAHTLALRRDGTVWAWGANNQGQLGTTSVGACRTPTGSVSCSLVPVRVSALTHVVEIAAGGDDSLALKRDGTVWMWGANGNQQLGFFGAEQGGISLPQRTPLRLPHLSGVVAIQTDGFASLAVKKDGTLWGWGDIERSVNGNDQSLAAISGLTNVVAAATAGSYSLALKKDGTVWAWGTDSTGGLLGTAIHDQRHSYPPQRVHALAHIVAIAAGDAGGNSLALKKDGTVWAWGTDPCLLGIGQCDMPRDMTQPSGATPVRVHNLTNIVAIAAGYTHDVALGRDGRIWVWGTNTAGQLGIGTSTGRMAAPILVQHTSKIVAIAVGDDHTVALRDVQSSNKRSLTFKPGLGRA